MPEFPKTITRRIEIVLEILIDAGGYSVRRDGVIVAADIPDIDAAREIVAAQLQAAEAEFFSAS